MPKNWYLTIKNVAGISFEICEKIKEIKFIFMVKSSSSVLPWWSFQTFWPDLVTFCFWQSDPLFVKGKFRTFCARKVIFIFQISKFSTKFVFLLFLPYRTEVKKQKNSAKIFVVLWAAVQPSGSLFWPFWDQIWNPQGLSYL